MASIRLILKAKIGVVVLMAAGAAFAAPYEVAGPDVPNRLIYDAGLPEGERLTHTNINPYKPGDPLLPSGLLGPVQVVNVGS